MRGATAGSRSHEIRRRLLHDPILGEDADTSPFELGKKVRGALTRFPSPSSGEVAPSYGDGVTKP